LLPCLNPVCYFTKADPKQKSSILDLHSVKARKILIMPIVGRASKKLRRHELAAKVISIIHNVVGLGFLSGLACKVYCAYKMNEIPT
jgi:hypothetical protein